MSLSFPYSTAFMEISSGIEEPELDDRFNQSVLPHFPSVYGSCCITFVWCLLLNSKSSSLSSLTPCFISTAWLKSSYKQSVFLSSVPPTISSIRLLLWTLIFSLNGSFSQMDAEKLIGWGSTATVVKRYGLEEYTLWSAWGGECVYGLLCTLPALLLCLCVGCLQCMCVWGVLRCCVLLFWCVHQDVSLDYWMCAGVSVCSLFVLVLIIFVPMWCVAATVISGLLRRSSSPAPD